MMTREEIKLLYAKDALRSGHIDIIFDKIDDFESRTCENCKYYVSIGLSCHNRKNEIVYWSPHEIPKDFGCNKFERKTDGDV